MALTIVLGLAILSVANYGNTFEFSGLDPSVQSKTLKPTIKPFSSFANQPGQKDVVKPTFAGFKNVPTKPFGSFGFDSFKPSYQPYQPGPFRANYQPFGPYPGYPGPVVYPGQGGYLGPAAHPVPPHHFDDPNHRPFAFQPPFSESSQQSYNPFKFGLTKKFNKNIPRLGEINLPGKYFQEHQFGAYHGPEFSSAIVPAEHNFKQSKPKDTLLEKPAVPALPELGFPKQNVYGFAPPPPSFRYPLPSFPPNQPFFNTVVPSVTGAPAATAGPASASPAPAGVVQAFDFGAAVTTAAAPTSSSSQDESATAQQSSEVTGEPSATPAADPQPTGPSQEEATTAADVVEASTNNNDVPAADTAAKEQSEQSDNPTEAAEPGEKPVAVQENDSQSSAEKPGPVVVEPLAETSGSDGKSGDVKEAAAAIKPTEPAVAANVPGLPNELYSPIGDVPASVQPYLGASGYPFNFGQTADPAAPSYFAADFEAPKFTEEDLKRFEASFVNGALQPFQVYTGAVAGGDSRVDGGVAAAADGTTAGADGTTARPAEGGEKKEAGQSESRDASAADAPKKSNTVQVVQDDPFNGQFPLLFDPSNAGASPLDPYGFYSHPSVSALSTQASLASYSPEDAFANFGTSQFRQGYLVEGSPSLTPVTKTVVQTGQLPIPISSKDHPLHSQVFSFSQPIVPYPEAAATFRSLGAPASSTVAAAPEASSEASTAAAAAAAAADAAVPSSTEAAAAESSSSTETA